MITLCTLTDSKYMPKCLSLIASIRRHSPDSALYVLCLDGGVTDYFDGTTIKGVVPIRLAEVESPDVLRAKADRTRIEYYWTLASVFTLWCAEKFNLPNIAYIDADCYLFGDLAPLYDEVGEFPVAITPHRYTPSQRDRLKGAGIYNVGWVYFSGAGGGYNCLRHWRTQCLEWCKWSVQADGRFADQGYLDDWPTRWGAHTVYNLGTNLAPWNAEQYNYEIAGGKLIVSDGRREDALMLYHFHGLIHDDSGKVTLKSGYPIPKTVIDFVYSEYEHSLIIASQSIS